VGVSGSRRTSGCGAPAFVQDGLPLLVGALIRVGHVGG
jgi:hypothetical protein